MLPYEVASKGVTSPAHPHMPPCSSAAYTSSHISFCPVAHGHKPAGGHHGRHPDPRTSLHIPFPSLLTSLPGAASVLPTRAFSRTCFLRAVVFRCRPRASVIPAHPRRALHAHPFPLLLNSGTLRCRFRGLVFDFLIGVESVGCRVVE